MTVYEKPPAVAQQHQVVSIHMQHERRPLTPLTPGWRRLRVAAAGVNRADLLQAAGIYPAPPGDSPYLGLEAAGQCVETGERLAALCPGGGYSDYAAVPAAWCFPVPDSMPLSVAAALPEALFTAAAFITPHLKDAPRLLLFGAAGGVGHIVLQLAKIFACEVTAVAGGAEKKAFVTKLGADAVVDYQAAPPLDALKNERFDLIVDILGGRTSGGLLRLLRPGGTLVQLAVQSGVTAGDVPVGLLLVKGLHWQGGTLRGLSVQDKNQLAATVRAQLWPLVERGLIKPVLAAEFPLEQAAAAHALLSAGKVCGKVVLRIHSP